MTHDLDGLAEIEEAHPAVVLFDGYHTVRYAWAASEWPGFPDDDAIEAVISDLPAKG